MLISSVFSFYSYAAHRALHSFPTRRSSDLVPPGGDLARVRGVRALARPRPAGTGGGFRPAFRAGRRARDAARSRARDRKSTRLNSSHLGISYAVFCLKKKNNKYYALHVIEY